MTGLETAALVLLGVLLGRFLPNRRKGPKPAKPVEPVCGCEHHHSYHDPKTGICNHGHRLVLYRDSWNTKYGDFVKCPCKQYSGPVPVPEFFAPEVSA